MPRSLLTASTVALVAATALQFSTLGSAEAKDCVIDADSTMLNGGLVDCEPLDFTLGDTLKLSDDVKLTVHASGTPALQVGSDTTDVNGVTVINDGTINFIGNANALSAIEYYGDNGFIYNNGDITANNANGGNNGEDDGEVRNRGIRYLGDGGYIENNGTITTIGNRGHGIAYNGSNGRVVNNGTIDTSGYDARGVIMAGGANNEIINNDKIITTGHEGHALWVQTGGNGVIINNGLLQTSGHSAGAIYSQGENDTIYNYGTIVTSGTGLAEGISADIPTAWVYNYGSIETGEAGNRAIGIRIGGGESLVCDSSCTSLGGAINYGTITTSGRRSEAMLLDDYGGTLINHGTVETTGGFSSAMLIQGAGPLTVVNSGLIRVAEYDPADAPWVDVSHSIRLGGRGASDGPNNDGYIEGTTYDLTLLNGSVLIGWVGMAEPEHVTVNFGPGLSSAVHVNPDGVRGGYLGEDSLEGVVSLTSANGVHAIKDHSIFSADTSELVAQDTIMAEMTSTADNVAGLAAFAYVSTDNGSASDPSNNACTPWLTPYGGHVKSEGSDSYTAFEGAFGGMAMGCQIQPGLGLMGGVAYSQVEASDSDSFSIESVGGFMGLYGSLPSGQADFMATLGYMHNSAEKQIADNLDWVDGIETLSDDYGSVYFAPSMTFNSVFVEGVDIKLSYTGIWHAEYAYKSEESKAGEEGYEKNHKYDLSSDSRYSQVISGQMSYNLAVPDFGSVKLGGGLSWQQGGDASMSLAGTSFDIEDPRDGLVGEMFASFNVTSGPWGRLGASLGEDERLGLSIAVGTAF